MEYVPVEPSVSYDKVLTFAIEYMDRVSELNDVEREVFMSMLKRMVNPIVYAHDPMATRHDREGGFGHTSEHPNEIGKS